MRVVSLVPSLTETLIDCGVEVVGRTRYCIHPNDKVADVVIVGGTKSVHWDRCEALSPDLVLFDREENTKEMADSCPLPWHATHITDLSSVAREMRTLAEKLNNAKLTELAEGWQRIESSANLDAPDWASLPGLIRQVGDWSQEFDRIEYIIWKDPWMAVSRDTFIGSMLTKVGFGNQLADYPTRYPELEDVPRGDTFYLFSTEPFPFERHVAELETAGFNGALVDGELYSWFGIRSYRKLMDVLELN